MTDKEALQIAFNALVEIDRQTPYPIAKHALMVINEVLKRPAQDWEAVAADQAMTIAMLRQEILNEREACAKVCDEYLLLGNKCAAAIRARGDKHNG